MAVTTITGAGTAAVVNAQATGASGVVIATCGVVEAGFEIKTLPVDGVELITPGLIRVGIKDQSTDIYTAEKLNFYLDDTPATLFATITEMSQAKASDSIFMALMEIDVSAAGSSPVTPSGAITMSPPVSTTEIKGIIETATVVESTAGTDSTRAVTPEGMRSHGDARYLQSVEPTLESTTVISGTIETATIEESTAGTDTVRAVTSAGMRGHGDARYLQSLPDHGHPHTHGMSWGTNQLSGYINSMDATFYWNLDNGYVMTGLGGYHSNHHEDRQWRVYYTSLSATTSAG